MTIFKSLRHLVHGFENLSILCLRLNNLHVITKAVEHPMHYPLIYAACINIVPIFPYIFNPITSIVAFAYPSIICSACFISSVSICMSFFFFSSYIYSCSAPSFSYFYIFSLFGCAISLHLYLHSSGVLDSTRLLIVSHSPRLILNACSSLPSSTAVHFDDDTFYYCSYSLS
jgi:hypothetical protein